MIYLLRHGQTEFNAAHRLQGRLDSTLTELGVEQARRMGRCLRDFVDEPERVVVIASPSGRTRRTAEIVCEELGLNCEIRIEPRLAEIDVGPWEGRTREEVIEAHPGLDYAPGWLFRCPGVETIEALEARLRAWLDEVDETDGTIRVVVSHGAAGHRLRGLYAGDGADPGWPPQDAVFRLWQGVVGRIDTGPEDY